MDSTSKHVEWDQSDRRKRWGCLGLGKT
jgi:hypothetical protein